jgi:DNA-binding MarR family transcriptional regulator
LLSQGSQAVRLIEEAADELGRLDAVCGLAPNSVESALRLIAIAGLTEPTRSGFFALVAADADPLHDAALPARCLAWRDQLAAEERRVRGGALLTAARFASVERGLDAADLRDHRDDRDLRERLETIWREAGASRSVLERALDSAAWSPDAAVAEASAALLLCAGGRTDRVRLLPFADVTGTTRADAIAAHRAGDTESWAAHGLRSLAARARRTRLAAASVLAAPEREERALAALGRAAITARAALVLLRRRLASTGPALAEDLGISRPAASDALERLVAAGLAREVTGRARDRVFAYEAACAMAESLLEYAPT